MKHKIQITMEYETEDMDTDDRPLSCGKVQVAVDDENLGFIQDLKLHVIAGDYSTPQLEIVFPDAFDPNLQYTSSFAQAVKDVIKKLSMSVLQPNVKIYLRSLTTGEETLLPINP